MKLIDVMTEQNRGKKVLVTLPAQQVEAELVEYVTPNRVKVIVCFEVEMSNARFLEDEQQSNPG